LAQAQVQRLLTRSQTLRRCRLEHLHLRTVVRRAEVLDLT
jgi:hypothetical protein